MYDFPQLLLPAASSCCPPSGYPRVPVSTDEEEEIGEIEVKEEEKEGRREEEEEEGRDEEEERGKRRK
jgi:hypothetical protein